MRFEQTDLHGISRSKTIPAKHVESFARGGLNFLLGQLGFDAQAGVAPGTGYLEDRGFPDSKLYPDLDTYAILPWADSTARLLCTPHFFDGTPAPASPRLGMARLCEALGDEGYQHLAGYEYELYLVRAEDRQPPFTGIQIFATLRNSFDEEFVTEVLRAMPQVGVDSRRPGVHVQERHQGDRPPPRLYSLFPRSAAGGSAGSSRTCLPQFTVGANNAVRAGSRPGVVSSSAKALRPLRFKLWSFAPVNASWAFGEPLGRDPGQGPGRGRAAHRDENRVPCGASNPYLVGAAAIAAGLDSIRNHIEPPPPTDGLAYGIDGPTPIPTRLEAALDELEKDTVLRGLLGEELIHLFLAVKRHEIAKATEHARDYPAHDWTARVDEFEVAELFEFL